MSTTPSGTREYVWTSRSGKRPLVSGIILLGLGLFLLAVNLGYLPRVERSWPVIIILIGVAILISTLSRSRRN